jgi:hypothetical protein
VRELLSNNGKIEKRRSLNGLGWIEGRKEKGGEGEKKIKWKTRLQRQPKYTINILCYLIVLVVCYMMLCVYVYMYMYMLFCLCNAFTDLTLYGAVLKSKYYYLACQTIIRSSVFKLAT